MKILYEPLWATALGWSLARSSGLPDTLANLAPDLGPISELSATAILGALLWIVVRDLKSAVEKNTEATQDLKFVIGELKNLFSYGRSGRNSTGDVSS